MKRTRFLLLPALALLLLLVGLLGLSSQQLGLVHASSPTVIVINCHDSGPGSLRGTIASAPAGSTITFSLSCDIKLKSTLVISKTLTLDGRGHQVTLDGQHTVRVLFVKGGVTLTLNTLTIANGFADRGGGLANLGTLSISNSTFAHNSASSFGGGLYNDLGGTLSISNSTVSDNSSSFGGGIENASFSGGTLSISNSTVSGNSALVGGGLDNLGTLSISNSTFAHNSASNSGGGLDNSNDSTLSISNSTVSGNSASFNGGGLDNGGTVIISNSTFAHNSTTTDISGFGTGGGGLFNGGTLRISNSTVSGNSAPQGGGGLFNFGTLHISNSTVSGNSAPFGGGILNRRTLSISNSTVSGNFAPQGGGIDNERGTVRIGGSIMANTGSNCAGDGISSRGYNLSSDSSCGFTGTGDLQNTDPKLDPAGLQNNGGPTKTIALQPDSPAVDKIPVGSQCPATDQRGVPRPQGPKCDIGAFEMTAADGLRVMIHVVDSFQLGKGLQTSLDQQLQAVLADLRAHQLAQACQDLTSFINHVKAQSGKGLTRAQATQFLTEAAVIHTRLGC